MLPPAHQGDVAAALAGPGPRAGIGTSSVRRIAQLRRPFPAAVFLPIRGNVDTRLRKLDAGEYDALVLAAAGLRRLGFGERISAAIPADASACRRRARASSRSRSAPTTRRAGGRCSAMHDAAAAAAPSAERAVVAALGGGCQLPLGALATVHRHRRSSCRRSSARPTAARIVRAHARRTGRQSRRRSASRWPSSCARGRRRARFSTKYVGRDESRTATHCPRDAQAAIRLHRRRRPRRSVPAHRPRAASAWPAPTSWSTTTRCRRLLRSAPPGCRADRRRRRGAEAARPGRHQLLLVEKAREGKTVVRLKWGDPFVFDSGGKEALFLHEQRIPFEVVPGVPLAIGGPAYAGIPITYPGAGDVVVLVRGHEAETDEPPHVDWYARRRRRRHARLLRGRAADRRDRQRAADARPRARGVRGARLRRDDAGAGTMDGTLGDIVERAREDRPALLVVGAVVGLRQHLRWFDSRPLFGRRIVVTRSREQAGELVEMLEERGAESIAVPTIRICRRRSGDARRRLRRAATFDWIMFTSVNAVDHFMGRFLSRRDIRDLKGPVCAVGPSTAAAVATTACASI